MKDMRGIYAALITPFDEDGSVNTEVLGRIVEYALGKGVDGFYVCGSTGEAFMLTLKERRQILDTVIAAVNGRAKVISHVGSMRMEDVLELARYAKSQGADGVSSLPPLYYKYSFDEIVDYYARLAGAAQLPTIIYNFPANSGVSLSMEQFCKLLSIPGVIGIKHTSQDLFALERIKRHMPDKLIFNGYDEVFLSGMIAGADGAIGSTFNFMGDLFVQMRKLFCAGRIEEARAIQHRANDVIEGLIPMGVLQCEKEIMTQLGFASGSCRSPYLPLTQAQKAKVAQIIGNLEG